MEVSISHILFFLYILQTHICVGRSYSSRIIKVYQDGKLVEEVASGSANIVAGGGGLVFGQEQDSVFGQFNPRQTFK